ncbi:hypothetical protein TNCT_541281 [Trichonephila clavata]|uniref:Uncharacterized protein n=1 Tax=Trichonephila clavata TaxID=2740835 RepID=A0A8X6FKC4_TRICU|nr:hypothetical protein TNCT_541281 [Trichonephila clavata]
MATNSEKLKKKRIVPGTNSTKLMNRLKDQLAYANPDGEQLNKNKLLLIANESEIQKLNNKIENSIEDFYELQNKTESNQEYSERIFNIKFDVEVF